MLPLTEPVVVPGKLTEVTATLSLATTEKVTVLVWEFEYKLTTFPALFVVKLEIVGSWVSVVVIVISLVFVTTLPAASETTTLTVSVVVLLTVKSL